MFDQINVYLTQIWKHPDTLDLITQIIIGVILLVFGFRRPRARDSRGDSGISESITPPKAFIIAAGLVIIGIPGAIPYLAAIDMLLRADLSGFEVVLALLYYNVLFILPLAVLVFIRVLFPNQSERIFDFTKDLIAKWGRRVIVTLLVILGLVMVVDGIGWFLGIPLIPV
jgi:cytochrome c biogenesis factor